MFFEQNQMESTLAFLISAFSPIGIGSQVRGETHIDLGDKKTNGFALQQLLPKTKLQTIDFFKEDQKIGPNKHQTSANNQSKSP